MKTRIRNIMVALTIALTLGLNLLSTPSQPTKVYADELTPTPTSTPTSGNGTDGMPGGSGGGGGGL